MKRSGKFLLIGASIVAALACSGANAATRIGQTVSSETTVVANGQRVLRQNSQVFENDVLRSNETGLAQIEFKDGSKMVIGHNANVTLDETVFSRGGSQFTRFVVNTTSGAMRFISGESDSSAFQINTPTGTLGLRGTSFDMQHYKGQTYIMLVSGKVTFCDGSGNCTNISRRCDCMAVGPNGVIQAPVQPEGGIYTEEEMATFFPFIADQEELLEQFKQRIKLCKGGTTDPTITGDDPDGGDPAPSGGGGYGSSY